MPAKPQWLLHIPAILEQLRSLDIPVLDRSSCEQIFGVRRRRAVELMHRFGGYQSGNTVLLDRGQLIQRLEILDESPETRQERNRKIRLNEKIEKLHRYRTAAAVRIAVSPLVGRMPGGIAFDHGRMTLEFAGVEELLGKLYSLSQAAASDFEGFRSAVEGKGTGSDSSDSPTRGDEAL